MRLHRLISILLLIEAKGIIKAKELSSRLEVSERTIYRDIDSLCEAGIPLVSTTGPNGGISLMEGYSVGISHLEEEDIRNLVLSSMGILQNRQNDMALKLNTAILKLQKNLSPKQNKDLSNIKRRFFFDDAPWWGKNTQVQEIDIIMRAVFAEKALSITYTKFDGKKSTRNVHPYGIVVKRMDWYLIAYCEKSMEIRTFKCERILKSEILNYNFKIPKDFFIEEYWENSQRMFKSTCAENEQYPVTIRIHKNKAEILKDLEIINIEERDEYFLAAINMYGPEYAVENIMKLLRYIEVISPTELRAAIKRELNAIISRL